jgi:hypothetical protein
VSAYPALRIARRTFADAVAIRARTAATLAAVTFCVTELSSLR